MTDYHAPIAAPTEPETPSIQVLFFAPEMPPEVRRIPDTLEAKQELVEGLITTFETGVPGTIGVANDEALVHDMELNRYIAPTGAHIFGPFFVAGDVDGGFRSLTPFELEQVMEHLAPELSQSHFTQIMRSIDGGVQWVESWE
ncbi:DUF3846 domain-containing protein [bacterium]|nr:MAG: DUF3846 domain-containing protein [bacterium]